MSNTPAIIIIDRDKAHNHLTEFAAQQWDSAADHIEEHPFLTTKKALVESLRGVASGIRATMKEETE